MKGHLINKKKTLEKEILVAIDIKQKIEMKEKTTYKMKSHLEKI